jgi:hypothetical protein
MIRAGVCKQLLFGLVVSIGLACGVSAAGPAQILLDDFEDGLSADWVIKDFVGRTSYRVVKDADGHSLRAESQAAASGLIYEVDYDPMEYPGLSWRWKIDDVIANGDARLKSGDDYPARVYVVFPHWFFPKTRTLNYIWANRLPKGESLPSPYAQNSIMLALESGPGRRDAWVTVRRNIVEDFRRVFGEDPPPVGAIAIMTDADDTGGKALAWYDDIVIQRE